MTLKILPYGIRLTEGRNSRAAVDMRGIATYVPRVVHVPLSDPERTRLVVSEGDEVYLGSLLAEPLHPHAVGVYASVSGRITAIGPQETPEGELTCVTVENNRRSRPAPGLPRRFRLGGADIAQSMNSSEIRTLMRDCGAVRMDGYPRPLHPDFDPATHKRPIEYVLIDACESEPYVSCVHAQLRENAIQAVSAARLLARAAGRAIPVLCLPDDRPASIQALRIAVEGTDVRISILKSIYPLGGEQTLVRAALGTEIPAGGTAGDVGALVVAASTAFALHDAAKAGMPFLRRVVTVGGRIADPANVWVPIGTPVGELVAFCGGMLDLSDRLVAGGPITGREAGTGEMPVTASTSAVLALPSPVEPETPCIRCGACVRACPERLLPYQIDDALLHDQAERLRSLHPEICTGCGACSYVCPAKRRLAPRIHDAAGGIR